MFRDGLHRHCQTKATYSFAFSGTHFHSLCSSDSDIPRNPASRMLSCDVSPRQDTPALCAGTSGPLLVQRTIPIASLMQMVMAGVWPPLPKGKGRPKCVCLSCLFVFFLYWPNLQFFFGFFLFLCFFLYVVSQRKHCRLPIFSLTKPLVNLFSFFEFLWPCNMLQYIKCF